MTDNEQATQATQDAQGALGNGTGEHQSSRVFATLDEAKASPAPSPKFKLYAVSDNKGATRYSWAFTAGNAVSNVARLDGYKAGIAEPKGQALTKERVAAKLAEFSDEELSAMGLSRKRSRRS
jgi:hypothetical protein